MTLEGSPFQVTVARRGMLSKCTMNGVVIILLTPLLPFWRFDC